MLRESREFTDMKETLLHTLNNLRLTLAAHYQNIGATRRGISSPRLRNALFILFIAAILAYGAAFAAYMLTRFDLVNIIRYVNFDDSFYYFQIAYNLSEGKFSTFDGITRTNGYHPLWLFAITPFYWVFDKESALFAIKAFEIMLVAGGVALIATAARLARLPWILLFALLPTLYGIHILTAGLEAALALFMLALLFLSVMLYARSPARWKWLLAAVAFALPWVRLEYIAISLAATGALCLMELPWRDKPFGASWRELTRALSRLQALPSLLAAVAGILVYFAYNQLVFGVFVPVSGLIKTQVFSVRQWWFEGGFDLARNFQGTYRIPAMEDGLAAALAVCGIVIGLCLLTLHARRRGISLPGSSFLPFFMVGAFGLAAGHLAKFIHYGLFVHPSISGSVWYYVPAYLMDALLFPIVCFAAIYAVRLFAPRWAGNASSLLIVIGGAIYLLLGADFHQPFRFVTDSSERNDAVAWMDESTAGVQVMNRLLPEGSVVGSWDAGILGYFSIFPVVNLDGLVNSSEYLHDLRAYGYVYARNPPDGSGHSRVIRQSGITHFANMVDVEKRFQHTLYDSATRFRSRTFKIWKLEPVAAFFDFYERMKPRFDYESDGVGLIVDGSLAQAFTQDCGPDEPAVWSWGDQANETIAKAWRRAQTGLCVTYVVLPYDAALPARIKTMSADDYLARLNGDSQPAIRSDFDVYLTENRLIYAKEQCAEDDTAPAFFLHIDPVDADDLPDHRKRHGFDNLDFGFEQPDATFGDTCMVTVPLPSYDIGVIRTGQYVQTDDGFKNLWEGEINLDAAQPIQVDLARLVGNDAPAIRSNFDVYLIENGLIYTKEQCAEDDTGASFFLHIDPIDVEDLPNDRKQHGFDNLDFGFERHGVRFDNTCVATVPLPDYDIAAIRTGQYVQVGDGFEHLWGGEIRLVE